MANIEVKEVKIQRYNLELTREEAETLYLVIGSIGGYDAKTGHRDRLNEIYNVLDAKLSGSKFVTKPVKLYGSFK